MGCVTVDDLVLAVVAGRDKPPLAREIAAAVGGDKERALAEVDHLTQDGLLMRVLSGGGNRYLLTSEGWAYYRRHGRAEGDDSAHGVT